MASRLMSEQEKQRGEALPKDAGESIYCRTDNDRCAQKTCEDLRSAVLSFCRFAELLQTKCTPNGSCSMIFLDIARICGAPG